MCVSPADRTHSAAPFEQFKAHPLWHVDLFLVCLPLSLSLSLCLSFDNSLVCVFATHTNTPSHSLTLSLGLCVCVWCVWCVCVVCVREREQNSHSFVLDGYGTPWCVYVCVGSVCSHLTHSPEATGAIHF